MSVNRAAGRQPRRRRRMIIERGRAATALARSLACWLATIVRRRRGCSGAGSFAGGRGAGRRSSAVRVICSALAG